jgi:hypothetical protein
MLPCGDPYLRARAKPVTLACTTPAVGDGRRSQEPDSYRTRGFCEVSLHVVLDLTVSQRGGLWSACPSR